MRKLWVLVCAASIGLAACSTRDEQYYRLNPQALQQAIKDCPNKQPAQISCEQLAAINSSVYELVYQIQINPQEFGKQILSIQQELAKQRIVLKKNPKQPELRKMIEENEQRLAERLAIVRWLESPES
ncbi:MULTISPECIES: hypothetical protein [unclassified Legionella]|uniref:hypothetical protein n=1 Tax=unclassified Legionella TaxID=2622702 RepID=UPI001E32BF8C|nr:hypothetical protein [Legionella sp. 31fI33]MCC5014906.1 hypothetical protein [Legionella sp. 31fI33]